VRLEAHPSFRNQAGGENGLHGIGNHRHRTPDDWWLLCPYPHRSVPPIDAISFVRQSPNQTIFPVRGDYLRLALEMAFRLVASFVYERKRIAVLNDLARLSVILPIAR